MRVPDKYAAVERHATPVDDNEEVEIVEVGSVRIRIDTVPLDTIASTPDDAAAMAIAMQRLSDSGENQLGFKVEYFT